MQKATVNETKPACNSGRAREPALTAALPTPRNRLCTPKAAAGKARDHVKVSPGHPNSLDQDSSGKSKSTKVREGSASDVDSASEPGAASSPSPSTPRASTPPSTVGPSPMPQGPDTSITASPPPAPMRSRAARVDSAIQIPAFETPSVPRLLVDTPYSNPHFGDPCTTNALDHLLKCGHKVMTTKPETCASNCMANHAVYANTRDLDQPFACLVCIASTQRSKHVARVAAFTRGLEQEAEVPGILRPQNWIQSELDVVEPMWHQIGQDEMLAKAGAGRFCHAVYFDPEIEILLAELVEKRLWPMAKAKDEEAKAKVMKEKDKQME